MRRAFAQDLKDRIHFTQYDAVYSIDPELAQKTLKINELNKLVAGKMDN